MKTISINWSTQDVLDTAVNMDLELTEQQADQILDNVYNFHDADMGINWYTIQFHIENFLDKE
jgi:hypothetical protein